MATTGSFFKVNSASAQALEGISSYGTKLMLMCNQARTAVFRFRKMKPDETVEFLKGRVNTREGDINWSRNSRHIERFRLDLAQCASEAARIIGYRREDLAREAKLSDGEKRGELEAEVRRLAGKEGRLLSKARRQWSLFGSSIEVQSCAEGALKAYDAAGIPGLPSLLPGLLIRTDILAMNSLSEGKSVPGEALADLVILLDRMGIEGRAGDMLASLENERDRKQPPYAAAKRLAANSAEVRDSVFSSVESTADAIFWRARMGKAGPDAAKQELAALATRLETCGLFWNGNGELVEGAQEVVRSINKAISAIGQE